MLRKSLTQFVLMIITNANIRISSQDNNPLNVLIILMINNQ